MSVLAENPEQASAWAGSRLGVFIDVNPGMDRTGIAQDRIPAIIDIIRRSRYRDRISGIALLRRTHVRPVVKRTETQAHHGYDLLMEIVHATEKAGIRVERIDYIRNAGVSVCRDV